MPRPFIALLLTAALAVPAAARNLEGHVGVGGNYDSGPLGPALSFKYWVSDLGLQALFAIEPQGDDGLVPGHIEYRPGVRVLYAMSRTMRTNLYAGAGVAAILRKKAAGDNQLYFEAFLGAEYFIGESFSIGGHTVASFQLSNAPTRALASAGWGASFHYYF